MVSKNNLSILYVVHGIPPYKVGGVEIYTLNLAKGVMKNGAKTAIVTKGIVGKRSGLVKRHIDGIDVYFINYNALFNDPIKTVENPTIERYFNKVIEETRPDIVHFNHLTGFPLSIIGSVIGKEIPACFTFHDFWLFCDMIHLFNYKDSKICMNIPHEERCTKCFIDIYFNGIRLTKDDRDGISLFIRERRKYYRELLYTIDTLDTLISPSMYLKNILMLYDKGLGEKIKVIPTGIVGKDNFNSYCKSNPARAKDRRYRLTFGFLGNIVPLKNLDMLLEAFSDVSCGREDIRLIIYGDYKNDYAMNLYQRYNHHKNISFQGSYLNKDIRDILGIMDIVVVPSLVENYPLIVLEALSCNIPVIAGDVGGISEIIKDGKNGILIKPDIESLKARLKYLIDNPESLDKMKGYKMQVKTNDELCIEMLKEYRMISGKTRLTQPVIPAPPSILFSIDIIANNYLEKGRYYFRERRLELAEQCFSYLYTNDKGHDEINFYLGMINYLQGEWRAALLYLEQLIDIKDSLYYDIKDALYALAICYTNLEETKKAIKYLRLLLKKAPHHIMANYTLSSLNEKLGNTEDAQDGFLYTLCLIENSQDPNINQIELKGKIYYHIGLAEYKTGNIEASRHFFKECLLINPDHIMARTYLFKSVKVRSRAG